MAPLLDALTEALRVNQQTEQPPGDEVRDDGSATSVLRGVAARHGLDLSRRGFPVEEVADSCRDLCQAITDLALEHDAPIRIEEFHALILCLDSGIADALKAFLPPGSVVGSQGVSDAQRAAGPAREMEATASLEAGLDGALCMSPPSIPRSRFMPIETCCSRL